jgi:hypothetical protein
VAQGPRFANDLSLIGDGIAVSVEIEKGDRGRFDLDLSSSPAARRSSPRSARSSFLGTVLARGSREPALRPSLGALALSGARTQRPEDV